MFLGGMLVGGLLMAAVLFCLLVLGFDRHRKELQAAEDKGYQDGYQRGWDERYESLTGKSGWKLGGRLEAVAPGRGVSVEGGAA